MSDFTCGDCTRYLTCPVKVERGSSIWFCENPSYFEPISDEERARKLREADERFNDIFAHRNLTSQEYAEVLRLRTKRERAGVVEGGVPCGG